MKTFTDFLKHLIKWERMLLAITAYNILFTVIALFADDQHGVKWFLLSVSAILFVLLASIYKRQYKYWKRWGC